MFVLRSRNFTIANSPLSATKVGLRAIRLAMHARMLEGTDSTHPEGRETPQRCPRVDILDSRQFEARGMKLVRPG